MVLYIKGTINKKTVNKKNLIQIKPYINKTIFKKIIYNKKCV